MLEELFPIFFLGFFGGYVPGPIFTLIMLSALEYNKSTSFRVIFWASVGETILSIICVFGGQYILQTNLLLYSFSFLGACILFYIAYSLWHIHEFTLQKKNALFSAKHILLITFTNGMAWIFWLSVCTPDAIAMGKKYPLGEWFYILAFEIGWISATISLALLANFFKKHWKQQQKTQILYRLISFCFVLFGCRLLWQIWQKFSLI